MSWGVTRKHKIEILNLQKTGSLCEVQIENREQYNCDDSNQIGYWYIVLLVNKLYKLPNFNCKKQDMKQSTFIHMKPTGTPSSPALENIAFPVSFVICIITHKHNKDHCCRSYKVYSFPYSCLEFSIDGGG